jgi:ABC-2 type transport system permease protein
MQSLAARKITGHPLPEPVALKTRFLYNPELNSRWFVVPGLMVVVLGILSILLTALTVAREWENGSMELLLSTPVEPVEIILGKLGPYLVLGLGAIAFVYLMARLGFGVPFRGNYLVFFAGCGLFLITYLAQGLLISVLTRRQQLAMQFSMMTGLLPSILLSGFIFPIESMPRFFRILTGALPARWFMIICRDVFLKGSGVFDLRYPFLALGIISVAMVTVSSRNFKKDLEP